MGNNRLKLPRWLIITACVVIVLSLLTTADYIYHRNRIYSGVFIHEQDMGKKTREEARELLQSILEQEMVDQKEIRFSFADQEWNLTFSRLGITPGLDQTVEEAFLTGREKLHIFRYPTRVAIRRKAVHLGPIWEINRGEFWAATEEIAEEIRVEPEDASFQLNDDKKTVEIVPGERGRELDRAATLESLQTMLTGYPELPEITISVKEVEAEQTAAFLEKLNVIEEIASFSTHFYAGIAGRAHNIRLAGEAIDEYLLLPDRQFSFNETVGRVSAETGYKPAPVIVRGELVDGIGGGICQVSSTLYNAALLSGLPIVERRNHSIRVAYLPPGLDATVVSDVIDLKFHNDRNHAIWIRAFLEGGRFTVRFYGSVIPGHEVKILTKNVVTIPAGEKVIKTSELPRGVREKIKDGQPGYKVSVWRVTLMDGQELKREKISEDSYKAVPAEYRVGTADVPAATEPQKELERSEAGERQEEPEQENGEDEANQ